MTRTRRQVAVLFNPEKPVARKAVSAISKWLKKQGVRPIMGFAEEPLSRSEFAVVLGGDGTILRAARIFAPLRIPILGVNVGRIGFLAETDFKDLYPTLAKALRSELKIDERLMVKVSVLRKNKRPRFTSVALNDCYFHAGANSRLTELEASVNGKYLATYTGDGIIVSTPTGSTAYSMAASGPIVSPNLPVILITPICPHTLAQRPILVSSHDKIELTVVSGSQNRSVLLSIDGQENVKIQEKERILIEAAPEKVKLLVHPQSDYYEILRAKLRWGER